MPIIRRQKRNARASAFLHASKRFFHAAVSAFGHEYQMAFFPFVCRYVGNLMEVGRRERGWANNSTEDGSDKYRLADLMRFSSHHSRRYSLLVTQSVCRRRERTWVTYIKSIL